MRTASIQPVALAYLHARVEGASHGKAWRARCAGRPGAKVFGNLLACAYGGGGGDRARLAAALGAAGK